MARAERYSEKEWGSGSILKVEPKDLPLDCGVGENERSQNVWPEQLEG